MRLLGLAFKEMGLGNINWMASTGHLLITLVTSWSCCWSGLWVTAWPSLTEHVNRRNFWNPDQSSPSLPSSLGGLRVDRATWCLSIFRSDILFAWFVGFCSKNQNKSRSTFRDVQEVLFQAIFQYREVHLWVVACGFFYIWQGMCPSRQCLIFLNSM